MSSQDQAPDIAMVDSGLGRPLFDEAVEAIHSAVLEEHQKGLHQQANATLILNHLRSLSARNHASGDRQMQCCRKLALFVHRFSPYFDVLSICTRVRPEWVIYFWGAFRLVVNLGNHYTCLLEKVADIFEVISHLLPSYKQIYETYSQDTFNLNSSGEDECLSTLMSCIYADLAQLFLELYRVFCRGAQGTDIPRFTIDASQPATWRPFDFRFVRLEMSLTKHRSWLSKETRNHVQNYEEIAQHRAEYINFLHSQSPSGRHHNSEAEESRLARRLRRVEKVTNWLSSRSTASNESDSRHDTATSCAWFLRDQQYTRWKNQPFHKHDANSDEHLESTWQHRVLFVQADQGFGNSTISRAVIEDLVTEAENLDIADEPTSAAYYHFDSDNIEKGPPEEAFRHLACQILRTHKHDHATLDAVCLLLRRTSLRERATTEEVLEVLSVLLRQHPIYLVIDGIDESSDVTSLLAMLARVCCVSDARVILFSRPQIRIPLEYQKWASDAPHILSLTPDHNRQAIEAYVDESLNRMADQGFFGIAMDRALIPQVARAANGNFLWVRMVLRFLKSQSLSSEERHTVLVNIDSLKGLEALYRNMLGALGRRPAHDKRIIGDVFRLLSFPINQLCFRALRAALSTFDPSAAPGEPFPSEIIEVLPDLTCGLIQAKQDTISFAHASVREYLQSSTSLSSEFSLFDESSVHAHLAARCLSYLAHDVPKRPLGGLTPPTAPTMPNGSGSSLRTAKSGDSGYKSISSSEGENHPHLPIPNNASATSIRTIPFDTQLPFLRYAALCWPIHLSKALAATGSHHATQTPYLAPLSAFLGSRLAVTSWVEASFRYALSPTLTRLIGPLSDLKAEMSPATLDGRELRSAVDEMRDLNEQLVELKREFATSLRVNPSLIWQMESSGSDAFWPVWEEVTNGGR